MRTPIPSLKNLCCRRYLPRQKVEKKLSSLRASIEINHLSPSNSSVDRRDERSDCGNGRWNWTINLPSLLQRRRRLRSHRRRSPSHTVQSENRSLFLMLPSSVPLQRTMCTGLLDESDSHETSWRSLNRRLGMQCLHLRRNWGYDMGSGLISSATIYEPTSIYVTLEKHNNGSRVVSGKSLGSVWWRWRRVYETALFLPSLPEYF